MDSMIPDVVLIGSGNTKSIPVLGLGTAVYPFSPESVKQSVLQAIRLGYRHFDTASLYQTEQPLGEAIAEALRLGLVKSRGDLFVTSKLWCSDAHTHLVLPAIHKTLGNLGLDYVDLYLIHWPISSKPGKHELFMDKEDLLPMDFRAIWEAMEECQKLGLAKSIGVSNFSCKKLQIILDTACIPPAVNQVEMNPFWQQKKLREFCKEKGVHVTAYSPLGAVGTPWGANNVLDCAVLKEIAETRGKTVAQVCLRWAYEQGVSLVVKSFNDKRMRENLDIFDWKLSSEDLLKIDQIPQKKGFPNPKFVYEKGPYKSLEELWDGEI
ncbi:Deoxymugineic acid synthase 1 [Ancistrocladus abbreviatus]